MILPPGRHEPPRCWPIPVRAPEGATSYWAGIVANASGHMSHHGAHGTEWTLIAPDELARLASLHPVATRRLPRVQRARLPTGPASWPTRQGTCPIMVLTARSGRWLLPTSWPAWRAYSSSRPDTFGGYRADGPPGA